uniref:Uncharacterized protein n=1 Tax=Glossina pallidipes TaxID=7398 RepID=A0A1B0AIU9_GLOPL
MEIEGKQVNASLSTVLLRKTWKEKDSARMVSLKPTKFMINGEKIVLEVCSMKMLQQKRRRRKKTLKITLVMICADQFVMDGSMTKTKMKLFGHKSDDITTQEAIICRIQYQELKA